MRAGVVVRGLVLVSSACLLLYLGGCGSGGSSSSATQLRVIQGMPQITSVDVVLDGSTTLFASALGYGATTGYLSVSAAQHTVAVEPTGSTNTLASASYTAASASKTTIVFSGLNGGLGSLVLNDDLTAPASGSFKIRVVNASPSGGAKDLYITAPGADLTSLSPNASNLTLLSASDYIALTAGDYEIRLTAAGTKSVQVDSGTVTFSSGQIRTSVVLDAPGGGSPFSLVTIADLN